MAKDLICGMDVDEATAEHWTEYKGTKYYFCAAGCKTTFEQDPEKYLMPSQHNCHCGCGG